MCLEGWGPRRNFSTKNRSETILSLGSAGNAVGAAAAKKEYEPFNLPVHSVYLP